MERSRLTWLMVAIVWMGLGAAACGGSTSPGTGGPGGSGAGGAGAGGGAGGAAGMAGTGGNAGTGGGSDPLAGAWESDYLTSGQRDTFEIRPDLTGSGTYYSVVPGVACAVEIDAQHGLAPGRYVGLLTFGAPCAAVLPMEAFDCGLTDGNNRLACGGDRAFHRRGTGGGGTGGTGGGGTGGTGGTGGGTGGTGGTGGVPPDPGDPLVGAWESEYLTGGQRDTFTIAADLTGHGTYYSVVPGTACAADISARHGLSPGNYVGVVTFGPPCSALMPMQGFSCTLAAARLSCADSKVYRRR